MNLAELRGAVADRCGVRSTDSAYATIDDRINEAIHLIETTNGGMWDYLYDEVTLNCTANNDTITFTALAAATALSGDTIRRVRYVETTVGTALVPITRRPLSELRAMYAGNVATERVEAYAVDAQRIRLFPTPSTVIAHRVGVVRTEPDLSGDTDTPLLPSVYHRIIVASAAGLLLRSLQRFAEAEIEERSASRGLDQMARAQDPWTGAGKVKRESWF